MTPLEISEYKLAWRSNSYDVKLHSDLDWKGKDWCRKHLGRHQWSFDKWTDVYEHTFRFENPDHANSFATIFQEYAKLGSTFQERYHEYLKRKHEEDREDLYSHGMSMPSERDNEI